MLTFLLWRVKIRIGSNCEYLLASIQSSLVKTFATSSNYCYHSDNFELYLNGLSCMYLNSNCNPIRNMMFPETCKELLLFKCPKGQAKAFNV